MRKITKICMVAGDNSHYIHSLAQVLAEAGLKVDLVGNESLERFRYHQNVKFINTRGSQAFDVSLVTKIRRIIKYYIRYLRHIIRSDEIRIVHIQGFRFISVEGLIFVPLFRLIGKKIIYTAHNTQPKVKGTYLSFFLFCVVTRMVNLVVCHTEKSKLELLKNYGLKKNRIHVIPHVLNYSVPINNTSLSCARDRLKIDQNSRVLLLFGNIRPYKRIEIALEAINHLKDQWSEEFILIIAGSVYPCDYNYFQTLKRYVEDKNLVSKVRFFPRFIPDNDIELFFKASDMLLLPYTECHFQSGVLFLAFTFGLPVIASRVGSFPEEIEDGVNGYIFEPGNSQDLVLKIRRFYQKLYLHPNLRKQIKQLAMERYSQEKLANLYLRMYEVAKQ